MGGTMRDIRADLQERASLLKEHANSAQIQFANFLEQLKRDHDSRLEGLKAELNDLTTVLSGENRRFGNG
jgi:hypothetical protein